MANRNTNLQNAKNIKDDEFYTTYETIEKEMKHYIHHFKDKTVLCNCDDPFESNFCKYFLINFNTLGLRRLICTSYKSSKVVATQMVIYDNENEPLKEENGYVLDIDKFVYSNETLSDDYINDFIHNSRLIKKLKDDGDFRSKEWISLKETDIEM